MKHVCKSWTPFFEAIKSGEKKHDLRVNDRNFEIGDIITLQSYDPFGGKYTGDEVDVKITYITSNRTPCAFSSAVLDKEYCILSLELQDDIRPEVLVIGETYKLSKNVDGHSAGTEVVFNGFSTDGKWAICNPVGEPDMQSSISCLPEELKEC